MAKFVTFLCLFLLATTFANSARVLDELTPSIPLPGDTPDTSDSLPLPETDNPDIAAIAAPLVAPPATTLPSGQIPATATIPSTNASPIIPTEPAAPVVAPIPDPPATIAPPITTIGAATATIPAANAAPIIPTEPAAPIVAPVPNPPAIVVPPATTTAPPLTTPAAAVIGGDHPTLSFFMHDILGGSHPSGRAVTGIVASSDANNLPFSKPNNQIFPLNGGVPLNTVNGVVDNNNYPFLVGLNGGGDSSNTLLQTNGNNVPAGDNNQPFVTAGQLPAGLTLQQLAFGSVTVVDNEITEGHELGTAVLGRAQGFYITSSTDGSSHTLALTAVFHGGVAAGDHHGDEIGDTLSFFGVHRTATPVSHIAIVGGTGKYENAKGFATIETMPHEDQHTTDGLETITHFTLYLTP